MKTYKGYASRRVTVQDSLPERDLNPRFDLVNHSPDGFNWGYGGSGPSQLALALCADVLGDGSAAQAAYMEVKAGFVERLPQGQPWSATEADILGVIRA